MIRLSQNYGLEENVNHSNAEQINRLMGKIEEDSIRHKIIGKTVLLTAFISKRKQEKKEGLYPSNSIYSKMMDARVSSAILNKIITDLKTIEPEEICRDLEKRVEECRQELEERVISTQWDRLYGLATYILVEKYNPMFLERIGRRVEKRLLDYRETPHYQKTKEELRLLGSNGSSDAKDMIRGIKAVRLLAEEERTIRNAVIDELRYAN